MKTCTFCLITGITLFSCQSVSDQEKMAAEIGTLEEDLAGDNQMVPEKLEVLLAKYLAYVEAFPDDVDLDVNFLHKAAKSAQLLGRIDQVMSCYNRIIQHYPDHPKAAQALFMKGYTFDNELKNLDSAKVVYQQFIQKYPNHDFADDAQFLLKNLGKSEEDIIQQLQTQ